MKKILLLLSFLINIIAVKAQYVTIADNSFGLFLSSKYPICVTEVGDGSYLLDTTCEEILKEKTLVLYDSINIGNGGFADVSAIQYFKSLTYLDCSNNQITNLPSLPTSLTYLNCSHNSLQSLPALPNSVTYINCSYNTIAHLPKLPDSLTYLDCTEIGDYQLDSLPSLPNSLVYLNCTYTILYFLPTLPQSLTYLNCSNSALPSLPSLPNSLTYLNCSGNHLTNLPILPNLLDTLDCSGCPLSFLPSLPNLLKYLNCSGEKKYIGMFCNPDCEPGCPCTYYYQHTLPSLPSLPDYLTYVDCSDDSLFSLPALPKSIVSLHCDNNNVTCIPELPSSLVSIWLDIYTIHCLPNSGNYTIYPNPAISNPPPIPLCNPTNNIYHCQSFPVMSGRVFYDNNSNGIKDPDELYRPYVELQLSDSSYTFTNGNGYYEISVQSLGSYTLSVIAPTYYKAVPALMNYNFTNFDTLVTQDIPLQPTSSVDSLALSVYSYSRVARPGFDFPIVVNYSNVGTTTLSPNLILNYDNTLLNYHSSSDPDIVDNGNSLSLSYPGLVPGQANSFVALFTPKIIDPLGDSIETKVIIDANNVSVIDSINTLISSSYDPNDKEATSRLTPQQVVSGKGINYIIRFQNTGNDTAFNIVLADTLSNFLDATSLQVTASSIPCKVTVMDNVVFFEFLNALLPDSNINLLGSNGFVNFTIKPLNSITNGTAINNTASIYFDYNSPIVTNTATTLIQDSNSVVPLKLISFNALTQTNTNNALLYWKTANEINTKYYVVQQSDDGINFTDIGNVAAKDQSQNSYTYNVVDNNPVTYYRLKMIDNSGQYSYSAIVSIKTQQSNHGIVILNNPAKNMINIRVDDITLTHSAARLLDDHGAVVKEFILNRGSQSVDVSALPAGEYFIQSRDIALKVFISR